MYADDIQFYISFSSTKFHFPLSLLSSALDLVTVVANALVQSKLDYVDTVNLYTMPYLNLEFSTQFTLGFSML